MPKGGQDQGSRNKSHEIGVFFSQLGKKLFLIAQFFSSSSNLANRESRQAGSGSEPVKRTLSGATTYFRFVDGGDTGGGEGGVFQERTGQVLKIMVGR
jgi:hypothetical protein